MGLMLTTGTPLARVAGELEEAEGTFVSGQALAERAGVSRNAVWKHVAQLRRLGYRIESARRLGHRLVSRPDRPLPWTVTRGLGERPLVSRVYWYDVTASTQAEARRLADAGAPEGTVVLAEEQRGGRGRFRQAFVSPPGGLWFTIILRPPSERASPTLLSLLAARAVQRGVEDVCGVEPLLLWPKELLLDGRKLGGVLAEVEEDQDGCAVALLGVGLNVNVDRARFPMPLRESVVSLREALGRPAPLTALCQAILREFDARYTEFLEQGGAAVAAAWRRATSVLGRQVALITESERVQGVAEGVDDAGALLLRSHRGLERHLHGVVQLAEAAAGAERR